MHLNCAASLDGKIAAPDGSRLRLSDENDWNRVHRLRADCDAILVGVRTILSDDPSLKVDPERAASAGRQPIRVVLDTHGRTPKDARVVDGSAPTHILTGPDANDVWDRAEPTPLPLEEGRVSLTAVLDHLATHKVRTLLVEGGGTVLRAFISQGLVDTFTLYTAPVMVGGNGPSLWPGDPSGHGRRLHVEFAEKQGKGVLWTFRP